MKMREIKRKVGNGTVHVWPPAWASSYGADSRFTTGDEGVLDGVHRWGQGLSVTMMFDGREHLGSLEWDPPPALADVGKVLTANCGREIRAISELNV